MHKFLNKPIYKCRKKIFKCIRQGNKYSLGKKNDRFYRLQGHGDAWDELIYPGMKQGLVGSLLASQEAMDRRKNSFELYGADFMVMEDFSVWLIEINSHPDMSYSTSVTTRLCRQVMEDTIKGDYSKLGF